MINFHIKKEKPFSQIIIKINPLGKKPKILEKSFLKLQEKKTVKKIKEKKTVKKIKVRKKTKIPSIFSFLKLNAPKIENNFKSDFFESLTKIKANDNFLFDNLDITENRLKEFGRSGGYGNAMMQISLIWNTKDDIDLSAETLTGDIYFHNKENSGGKLDIDMNIVSSKNISDTPIENIVWDKEVPTGYYNFYVNYHSSVTNKRVKYELRLRLDSKIYYFKGILLVKKQRAFIAKVIKNKGKLCLEEGNYYRKEDISLYKYDREKIIIKID